jgi:hypothetical protein
MRCGGHFLRPNFAAATALLGENTAGMGECHPHPITDRGQVYLQVAPNTTSLSKLGMRMGPLRMPLFLR